jgi:hypothetical protein
LCFLFREDKLSEKRRRAWWFPDIVLVGSDSLSASKQNLSQLNANQHLWRCRLFGDDVIVEMCYLCRDDVFAEMCRLCGDDFFVEMCRLSKDDVFAKMGSLQR